MPVMSILQKKIRTKWTWRRTARLLTQLTYAALIIFTAIDQNFIVSIAIGITSLLTGAFYCGWFCPAGAVQEVLGKLGAKLFGRRLKLPRRVETVLSFSRYIITAAALAGLALAAFPGGPYRDIFGILAGQAAYIESAAWIWLGLLAAGALLIDRPFCRYFCPQGARYGLLSMARLFSIKRNTDRCTNCGICNKACPAGVNVAGKTHVRNPQCINCMECIDACPADKALTYGWIPGIRKTKSKEINHENI